MNDTALEQQQPNRATVALVAERLDGLKAVTELGFATVREQLGGLVNLPVEVATLKAENEALTERVEKLEGEQSRHREWRRGPLLVAAVACLVAAINLIPVFLKI